MGGVDLFTGHTLGKALIASETLSSGGTRALAAGNRRRDGALRRGLRPGVLGDITRRRHRDQRRRASVGGLAEIDDHRRCAQPLLFVNSLGGSLCGGHNRRRHLRRRRHRRLKGARRQARPWRRGGRGWRHYGRFRTPMASRTHRNKHHDAQANRAHQPRDETKRAILARNGRVRARQVIHQFLVGIRRGHNHQNTHQ